MVETKFNMSMATLQRLDGWLQKAMAYYGAGLENKYFHALVNVRMNAQFKFKKPERNRLAAYEKEYFKETDPYRRCGIVKKYQEILLDLMDKYGLLLPNKIDDLETSF